MGLSDVRNMLDTSPVQNDTLFLQNTVAFNLCQTCHTGIFKSSLSGGDDGGMTARGQGCPAGDAGSNAFPHLYVLKHQDSHVCGERTEYFRPKLDLSSTLTKCFFKT